MEEGDEDEGDVGVAVAPGDLANNALPSMAASSGGSAFPSPAATATVTAAASDSRTHAGVGAMAGAGAGTSLASDVGGNAGSSGGGTSSSSQASAAPLQRKPKRAAFMSTGAAEKLPPHPSSLPAPPLHTARGFDDAGSDRCVACALCF